MLNLFSGYLPSAPAMPNTPSIVVPHRPKTVSCLAHFDYVRDQEVTIRRDTTRSLPVVEVVIPDASGDHPRVLARIIGRQAEQEALTFCRRQGHHIANEAVTA
jgi:hypothetical protein